MESKSKIFVQLILEDIFRFESNFDHFFHRKKKKSKNKKKDLEEAIAKSPDFEQPSTSSSQDQDSNGLSDYYSGKTKAEIAFLKKKEERDIKRIREKASVSHKERVEKFNGYLNSLSEHYEPAKVSWTK